LLGSSSACVHYIVVALDRCGEACSGAGLSLPTHSHHCAFGPGTATDAVARVSAELIRLTGKQGGKLV
jgi:hypothetical protein